MTPSFQIFAPPTIVLPSSRRWFWQTALSTVPRELEDIVTWADRNYRVMTKDSEMFRSAESPWAIEPLRMADDPLVAIVDYIKPVQVGNGTSVGEILLMRWILSGTGLIHYNWPTDDKAKDRWEKFTERRLRACAPVRAILPREYENMLIKFPGITFAMQGVFTEGHLDSDTVDYIVNEEVHDWQPGRLSKALGRQTRVDFPKMVNVSNAGIQGEQLHQSYNEGTQQHFMNYCPGCSNPHHAANSVYHILRTRWEENKPDLGGLYYDTDGCKRTDGTFDYNKLIPTIRYRMPCGYPMPDDPKLRRESAMGGKYSEPFNTGALLSHRSYTLQAVACHTKRWLDLIQRKHLALRMLKSGDDTEWRKFLQEDECQFYNPSAHIPFQGEILLSPTIEKKRAGLPNRVARLWKADWQKGYKSKGDLEHFWLVIKDVDADCNDLLIYEGRIDSENELIATLEEYDALENGAGIIDCSNNTTHLLQFVYRTVKQYAAEGKKCGMNAIMSNESKHGLFKHLEDGVYRFYDEGQAICGKLNVPPIYEPKFTPKGAAPSELEPVVININKGGMIANHFFIREHKQRLIAAEKELAERENRKPRPIGPEEYIECTIPGDVSEEFIEQYGSWIRIPDTVKKKPFDVASGTDRFRRERADDHMFICCAGIDMLKAWSGLLPERLERLGVKPKLLNSELSNS